MTPPSPPVPPAVPNLNDAVAELLAAVKLLLDAEPPPPPTDWAKTPIELLPSVVTEPRPKIETLTAPPAPAEPPEPPRVMSDEMAPAPLKAIFEEPALPPPPPIDCANTPGALFPYVDVPPLILKSTRAP